MGSSEAASARVKLECLDGWITGRFVGKQKTALNVPKWPCLSTLMAPPGKAAWRPTYFGEVPVDKFFQLRANFLVRQDWHFGNRITRHKLRLEAGDAIWGGQRFKRMGQVSLHID